MTDSKEKDKKHEKHKKLKKHKFKPEITSRAQLAGQLADSREKKQKPQIKAPKHKSGLTCWPAGGL